ncbi:dihydrolipoamide acetyltransferase family protein [Chachezhania sediminis]|uniref:dihydrolipoamide acetyltransferase family protein n=1 Tax=Chachezhania sediminis TaxID=2599291 RepID=UPI00131BD047|nr:dihydrolipoamide acetyltransferase family protein [Chachezhania sediminis]
MPQEVTIPKLGLTMTDCTLVDWALADGDRVAKGDVICTIETDKIATEIEADGDGWLRRMASVDSVLPVGALVALLHPSAEAALEDAEPPPPPGATSPAPVIAPAPVAATPSLTVHTANGRLLVSPVARRIATEAGLTLDDITGTGPDGAILKRDVEVFQTRPAEDPAIADRRPLAGMRRAISQRMTQSLQQSAQMTAFARVDMGAIMDLRRDALAHSDALAVRISVTDLVLKAAAGVLAGMPSINASIIGDEVVTWRGVHIGLAVALDDGLVVPVIRDADRKSVVEIAQDRMRLVDRARSGTLSRADVDGGTFSLSNFGSYGGDFETPILNPPQSALLGIGRITDEAVVRDGAIVARPMMMLSMTFDHRLIDGATAGRFRALLRERLETPALMTVTQR